MRSIKVLNFVFFFVFSPKARADGYYIVSTKVLIKLIGLLGPIDLWSLLDNFIETFIACQFKALLFSDVY